jgi:peptidoglycan/LPS O-acetylase OafA/YrhL
MFKFRFQHLRKADTQLYKGVGILLIVFHNFFHAIKPATGENEFTYSAENFRNFLSFIAAEPSEVIRHVSSYWGHYGVQIFFFLSAYGLTRSYGKANLKIIPFVYSRLLRLYPAFLIAIVLHAISVQLLEPKGFEPWYIKTYLKKLTLLFTFLPNTGRTLVGPWWFISCIFQFYAIFPLLLRIERRFGAPALLGLSLAGILFTGALNPILTPRGWYPLELVFGHLPELCLGIYLARADNVTISWPIICGALAIFVLSNYSETAWLFTNPSVTVLFLVMLSLLTARIRESSLSYRGLIFYGEISLYLFLVNGFTRTPFVNWAQQRGGPANEILAALCSLLFATIVSLLARTLEKYLRALVSTMVTKKSGRAATNAIA